jgi:transcription initiation factor TFIIIB Brf1 subunit/transcription initiation factor TFIIB
MNEWVKEVVQKMKISFVSNMTKNDKLFYRTGFKTGYRLAIQHLKNRNIKAHPENYNVKIDAVKVDPFINQLLIQTANENGVTVEEIISQTRRHEVVVARSIFINLVKELTPMSLVNIGKMLDGRDHTSILHHVSMKARRTHFWNVESLALKRFEFIKEEAESYYKEKTI